MSDEDTKPENDAPEPALEQPSGVVVLKHVGEDGSINTEVTFVGGVQATEVQTLLELGIKSWRQQIGL